MTQKELLYVEDAICHEMNMLDYLNEMLNSIQDENLITMISEHVENHQNLENSLMGLLEENANE